MVAGTVRIFCRLAGMKAVCPSKPGCELNSAECVNTPLSEANRCDFLPMSVFYGSDRSLKGLAIESKKNFVQGKIGPIVVPRSTVVSTKHLFPFGSDV